MHRQLAEQMPESLVLLMRQALVAEEDDEVFHQRVVHFLELLIAERARQVDAADLGADMRRQLPDLDRLVGHRRFLLDPTRSTIARKQADDGRMASMKRRKSVKRADAAYLCHFRPEPEGGFTVTCPKLPETLEEAQANAREAIELCLEVMLEDGKTLPSPDRDLTSP